MPSYGQSPWLDASEHIGGAIGNMNQIALQMARMKYLQAAQQQRQAIMLGQMAMRQHLDESTIAKNKDAGTNSLAQAGAAGAREKMTMAQIGSADRLGDQVWRKNMPVTSDDPNVPIPDNDPGMARIAGEQARMMALHGKTVPNQAINPGQNLVDPQGGLVAVGQNLVKFQPPGTTPYDASAQMPVGPQSGFRPSTPRTSDLDHDLGFAKLLGARLNEIGRASNPYDKNALPSNPEYQSLQPMYSNAVNRVQGRLLGTNDVSQGASQPKLGVAPTTGRPKPTRAQAAAAVQQFKDPEAARQQLEIQGYDTSSYAD